jgi:hypothetical protein
VSTTADAYTDANLFETIRQTRKLNGAGPHELVHLIRGEVTPDEQVLGSCTRRKPLTSWDPTVDAYTETNLFQTIRMLNGAGPHELVHLVRSQGTRDEQSLGSYTCRKFLTSWDPTVDVYDLH